MADNPFSDLIPAQPAPTGFDDLIPKAAPPEATAPSASSSGLLGRAYAAITGQGQPPVELQPPSLGQAAQDTGQGILDLGRVAANSLGGLPDLADAQIRTHGLAALFPGFAGTTTPADQAALQSNLAAERAQTAAASQRIGPAGNVAASLAGYGPMGALGIGAKTAEAIGAGTTKTVPRWLAGLAGAGTEGAAAAGAGAAGRGEDVLPAMAKGGAGGVIMGVPSAVFGRGTVPSVPSVDALEAAKRAAYQPAESYLFAAQPVRRALNEPVTELEKNLSISPTFQKKLDEQIEQVGRAVLPTGAEIDGFISSLRGKIQSAGDKVVFARIRDNLQNILNTEKPITGQAPGEVAPILDRAREANSVFKDSQLVAEWERKAAISGGPTLNEQASKYLQSERGKIYAPPGSPQYGAFNTLAGTSPGPSSGLTPWLARHLAYTAAGGIIGGLEGGARGGWDPYSMGRDALMAGLVSTVIPAAQGKTASAGQQRALTGARVTAATGQPYTAPAGPPAPFRDLLRRAYMSQAAGGF